MRLVLDTNVLVPALIFPGGPPEQVYRVGLARRHQLVSSGPLLAELGRVLIDKFGWRPARAEQAIAQIVRGAEIVTPQETIRDVEADPTDDRVLDIAAAGGADVIVSGDRHLLRLGSWRGIPIQSPAAFLAGLE